MRILSTLALVALLSVPGIASGSRLLSREFPPKTPLATAALVDALAISPDGASVYSVSRWDQSIGVHARDPLTGHLEGVQKLNPLPLLGIVDVAVSPDGAHVYVASNGPFGFTDDGVGAFSRDPVTGELTLLQSILEATSPSVESAHRVLVSADGGHVYVRTNAGTVIFERDAGTGLLTEVSTQAIVTPSGQSADGLHLYAGFGNIEVYSRDPVSGLLTLIEEDLSASGIIVVGDVTVSADGEHVYTTAATAIGVFDRDPVTGEVDFIEAEIDGVGGVDGLDGIRALVVSNDGAYVYASSFGPEVPPGEDALTVFARDAITGELTFLATDKTSVGVDNSADLVVSPDDAHLYVANNGPGAVSVFGRDVGTGLTTPHSAAWTLRFANAAIPAEGGALSYVAVPDSDAVVGLRFDATSGELVTVAGAYEGAGGVTGLDGVHDVALSPDESHLYAVGRTANSVVALSRAVGTGVLTYVETEEWGVGGVVDMLGPRSVVVSGDGGHVYVACHFSSSVAVFGRDPVTGALTFAGAHREIDPGFDGLAGATSVAASADGAHVYLAGATDGTLVVFSRDAGSGLLTQVEVHRDGEEGIDHLAGAASVVLSPDERFVYVYGADDSAVLVFARNPSSGALSLLDTEVDGTAGARVPEGDPMWNVRGLTLSPDGHELFVAGYQEQAFAVFHRDDATGTLAFIQFEDDDVPQARTHWISPDEEQVVAVGGEFTAFGTTFLPSFECPAEPQPGCRTAGKGAIKFRSHPIPTKESLRWTWAKGAATTLPEFVSGPHLLCGYDESSFPPVLVYEALARHNVTCSKKSGGPPCWTTKGLKGKYKNDFASPDGIRNMKVIAGDEGKTKIVVKAQGASFDPPALPLGVPFRLQFVTDSACWEATFSDPAKNDTVQFRASADAP